MTSPVVFWCRIWQRQIEQSAAMMAFWAQFVPHRNAASLSAEAEAEAAPQFTKPRRKAA